MKAVALQNLKSASGYNTPEFVAGTSYPAQLATNLPGELVLFISPEGEQHPSKWLAVNTQNSRNEQEWLTDKKPDAVVDLSDEPRAKKESFHLIRRTAELMGLPVRVSEELHDYALNVVPPVYLIGKGFVMGEPASHCEATGKPTYYGFRSVLNEDGVHYLSYYGTIEEIASAFNAYVLAGGYELR